MKPGTFAYHRVTSTGEAVDVLTELGEDGRVIAGGQSLVAMMNFRLAQPEHLVDLNHVEELSYVSRDSGTLAIGAMARQATVERSTEVRAAVPLLSEALGFVAHPTIRHRGTVVGSIAHADPSAELPTVAVGCGASVVIASASGTRSVAAKDFFLGPFETVLQPGEFVSEVRFPTSPSTSSHAFVEFARRHGDFAIAGAAVLLDFEDERIKSASITLCSVGPRPHSASAACAVLAGQVPTPEVLAEAVEAAVEGLAPGSDIHGSTDYRIGVARSQVRRALALALERSRGGNR